MIAANYVASIGKPDGLTLGWIAPTLYFDQLVGRKEVQFDWAKYSFIGSPSESEHQLYMRTDTPYKTIEDIRRASEPPKCGSGGATGTGFYFPRLLEETVAAKFNIVLGYQGGGPIDLAVEKGEVQCRGLTAAPYFGREPFISWRKRHFVNVLLYGGVKRDPRIPDTPTIYEIFDKENTPEETRRVADVILRGGDFGRPWVMPPETPAGIVKTMRAAYAKAMADPALVDERVSLLEQPCRRGHEAELDGVDRAVPIAADESILDLDELEQRGHYFDVINIKLDKCGGLTEGLMMARLAREMGKRVMVGNMVGTSLAMAPAFVLGQHCDIVDLDGPTFLVRDRAPGVVYADGHIDCPDRVWGAPDAVL